ncbi:hypothetical protein OHQ88_34255 (plasmid) [Micromonospora zamorensis]|uniref:hypothetical protein n=1 Tax=Micromonospora zamorensis TaxID=709883 RepID=UPI002E200E5E
MQTWTVDGRKVTNRDGAAEYLQLARATVNVYASPRGRERHGWPEPLPGLTVDGQELFLLDDLDAFMANRSQSGPKRQGETGAIRASTELADGDPDELIGVAEFAKIRGVSRDAFKRYVEVSVNAWDRGDDGYLPRYATKEPGPVRGVVYYWPRSVAVQWSFPAERRKASGRKSGVRPTVNDLKAAWVKLGPDASLRDLAATMSARLGVEVSMQVVRRLRRQSQAQPPESNQN